MIHPVHRNEVAISSSVAGLQRREATVQGFGKRRGRLARRECISAPEARTHRQAIPEYWDRFGTVSGAHSEPRRSYTYPREPCRQTVGVGAIGKEEVSPSVTRSLSNDRPLAYAAPSYTHIV